MKTLASAIEEEVILGPEPTAEYKVTIVNDGRTPVELIETDLTDEELWDKAEKQADLNMNDLRLK